MLSKLSSSINPDQTASFSPNKLCHSYKISCLVRRLKFCHSLKSSFWDINLAYKSFLQLHSTVLISLLLWMNLHKIKPPSSSNTIYLNISFTDERYHHSWFPTRFYPTISRHILDITFAIWSPSKSSDFFSCIFIWRQTPHTLKVCKPMK